jgi:hypothetical protein
MVFLPPLIEELREALEELYAGSVPALGDKDIKFTSSLLRCPFDIVAGSSDFSQRSWKLSRVGWFL